MSDTHDKDAQKEKLAKLEQDFGDAAMARAPYEGVWYLNMAYFAGDQWLAWDGNRLFKPRLRQGRILITDNRIQPAVRTEIAKMTKQVPSWSCTPDAASDDAVEGARRATRAMEAKWQPEELAGHAKLKRALEWSRVVCAGFWKITWDSSLGSGTEVVVGPDGKVVRNDDQSPMDPSLLEVLPPELAGSLKKQKVNRGDVRIDVRSPFEVFPDPLAEGMDECERFWEEVILSPSAVQSRFGVELKPDADYTSGMVEARMSAGRGRATTRKVGVRVRELWEKATAKHPQGRHAVWAGGKVLIDEPNPYANDEGRPVLPYVMFSGVHVPGRFWPTSVAEQLRPVQTELNKVKSQIAENRNRIGNPSVLISKQANIKMAGLPGETIMYDDTTQNAVPQYLQPPEMPAYVQNEVESIQQSIQEISGQHEVSSGTVPAGVTAAAAINLLQQQDDTRLGPEIRDMEESLSLAGQMVLRLIATGYTDERLLRFSGSDDEVEVMPFQGSMLNGQTRIRVTENSMRPQNTAAKQAAMQDIFGQMIQYGIRFDQRALRKFFREYEVGALESLLGDLDRDEAQVNRENRRLYELDANVVANQNVDNHEAHIAGHREEMKKARYEQACAQNPAIREIFEAHLKQHLDIAAQQSMPPMMPGPDGAPVPTGNPAAGAPAPGGPGADGGVDIQALMQSIASA